MNRKYFKKINMLLILTAIIIIASYSILSSAAENTNKEINTTEDIYIVVEKGDTLWDIAKKHKKEKEDIRDLIYKISMYNNMESLNIIPGQTIYIPTN